MSSSSDVSDLGRARPARAAERSSNFAQTCSLLSQYLKEKGTFGDLGLGMNCGFDANGTASAYRQPAAAATATTTMNLFPVEKKSGEVLDVSSRNASPTSRNLTSMDLFPQHSGFVMEEVPKKAESSIYKPGPETAPMTIFYAGQVIVFNDFPADKAKEVMLLASRGSSHKPATFPAPNPIESNNLIPSSSSMISNSGNKMMQERVQQPSKHVVNDLPIARKASLTRFLEKRKDRITAKAPYQASPATGSPAKPLESKSWLGLAAPSPVQL